MQLHTFLHNLLNVLVQIPNKMELQKNSHIVMLTSTRSSKKPGKVGSESLVDADLSSIHGIPDHCVDHHCSS
jgi:hypothetical protein